MKTMLTIILMVFAFSLFPAGSGQALWEKNKILTPQQGVLRISVSEVGDGKAHFYQVKAKDGTQVIFFVLKSKDGVIRAAVDACDVCYRDGKGYVQKGDYMVCESCGKKFASDKINVITGGCNPASLERQIQGSQVVIAMKDIDQKSWYCQYRKP